ncbi:MAG: hypothetical protein MUF58_17520 [Arcicella sp.]|nr:hypothetical protein [Arcicella sp.]
MPQFKKKKKVCKSGISAELSPLGASRYLKRITPIKNETTTDKKNKKMNVKYSFFSPNIGIKYNKTT